MRRALLVLVLGAAPTLGCVPAPAAAKPLPRLVLEAHAHETHAVAFSPDGAILASAGDGPVAGIDEITLWITASGSRRLSFANYRGVASCLAFSPDGSLLAVGSRDGGIALLEADTGAERISFQGRPGRIYCLAFSFDAKVLASVAYLDGDRSAEITRWDVKRGVPRDTLTPAAGPPFAISPEGAVVAWPVEGPPAAIRAVDLETHAERLLSKVDVRREDSLIFSPDGKWLAAVHQGEWSPLPNRCPYLYLINAQTGRIRLRSPRPFGSRLGLAISHDAKLLVRGVDAGAELWDVPALQVRSLVDATVQNAGGADVLVFSPNDKMLASTDGKGLILLWEVSRLLESRQDSPFATRIP